MKEMITSFEEMKVNMQVMSDKMDKIENEIKGRQTQMEEVFQNTTVTKIDEVFKVHRLRKKKLNNLILANIPDSDKTNPDEKKADDLTKIKEILACVSGNQFNEDHIQDFFRINNGSATNEQTNPKPKLLKIAFKDTNHRDLVLKRNKKLKEAPENWMKDIYMFPDLVLEDRQKRKELVKERDNRNLNLGPNEKKWVVRDLTLLQIAM